MAVPNDGGTNLPSDASSRYFIGIWDGTAFWAPRADNATAKNLRVATYDATGNPLFTPTNPAQVAVTSLPGGVGSLPSAAALTDGAANPTTSSVSAQHMLFNEASWDRARNNTQGTALAAAARTASVSSAQLTNFDGQGVAAVLNVTAASSTGGLTLCVLGFDPASATFTTMLQATAPVASAGTHMYIVYPGASGASNGVTQVSSFPLPRAFYLSIIAGDSTPYTYSVGYSLIK